MAIPTAAPINQDWGVAIFPNIYIIFMWDVCKRAASHGFPVGDGQPGPAKDGRGLPKEEGFYAITYGYCAIQRATPLEERPNSTDVRAVQADHNQRLGNIHPRAPAASTLGRVALGLTIGY